MMDIEFVRSRFIKHFDGKTGNVYASPGRINLIGEHTDYNGGFVFPGAVDKGIMAEMRANGTEDTVMAYAIDLKDRVDFKLSDPNGPRASWARYIYGISLEMKKLGVPVKGFNIAFAGDVPLGAGMSSSAAMESCFACGLNDIFGENKVSQWDMVLAGQATEHNYCGVNCGIMDQFASVFGKAGCLMRLDCRSREFEYFPFKPDGYRLVLLDSVVKHHWRVHLITTVAIHARMLLSTLPPSIRKVSLRPFVTAHGNNSTRFALKWVKKITSVLSSCLVKRIAYWPYVMP